MIAETITNFDIFLISKSKIDSTFPNMQFKINGYKLFRCDRNRFGRGLMLYLNEKIPCKFLKIHHAEIKCRNNLHGISSIKT